MDMAFSKPADLTTSNNTGRRYQLAMLMAAVIWALLGFINLYNFSYASMDSWCYAAPAVLAKYPFDLRMPFLGTFDPASSGWGLHWPGGLFVTSIVTPFLPKYPATYVLIFMLYWLGCATTVGALVRRLSGSAEMAFVAFLLILSDHLCFSITWLQRYELFDGMLAVLAILALGRKTCSVVSRMFVIALTFFLFPLLHPIYVGIGFFWLIYLLIRASFLRQRQEWHVWFFAVGAYALGALVLILYYVLQPARLALFLDHAHSNVEITRATSPPGIGKFLKSLALQSAPIGIGTLVYLCAFVEVARLAYKTWSSGSAIKNAFISEPTLALSIIGLVGALLLSQSTYNLYYWSAAWPFAVVLACQLAEYLRNRTPKAYLKYFHALLLALLLVHMAFWPARTYKWYQQGCVNYRAEIRRFVESLPSSERLFIPDSLWDSAALEHRQVLMNTLPYNSGDDLRKKYESYLLSTVRSGDVLIVDKLQSHPISWNSSEEWKEIAHYANAWKGTEKLRGLDLTAYQKR